MPDVANIWFVTAGKHAVAVSVALEANLGCKLARWQIIEKPICTETAVDRGASCFLGFVRSGS
jgi:hypothetical protein